MRSSGAAHRRQYKLSVAPDDLHGKADYVADAGFRRVAIIVGSPNVLVVPVTAFDLMHSPEDNYIRYPYVNLLRYIRYIAGFLALLLPGLYVAITNYHQEMIPTDLLLAIEASRERSISFTGGNIADGTFL